MKLFRNDRDHAFSAFFETDSARLVRLGTFLTGDAERGADLAQEALARTYTNWGRIKSEGPGPYARRILVNLVRSQHRRALVERKHRERLVDRVESSSRHVDDWLLVSKALQQLPPMRRSIVVLRYYEDLPEREIAEIMDVPAGTVKSTLHRALAQLKPLLEGATPDAARR